MRRMRKRAFIAYIEQDAIDVNSIAQSRCWDFDDATQNLKSSTFTNLANQRVRLKEGDSIKPHEGERFCIILYCGAREMTD